MKSSKFNIIILVVVLFGSFVANANINSTFSMRRCMLLPISDKVEGAVGFKVFQKVEEFIKFSDWCYYKSNSGILSILQNYQPNLEQHLSNIDVLKTIATKTRSGSLIHIKLNPVANGVDVEMFVYADNGEDIYFKDKIRLKKYDVDLIATTIQNWLTVYEKTIPYDGRVIGVLGDQFTIDIGKASKVFIGNELRVLRPIDKKKHPLLNEVVEWQSEELGSGKISNISEFQAQGNMIDYETRQKVQPGDWVVVKQKLKQDVKNKVEYPDLEGYEFGQLGMFSFGLKLGNGSDTTSISNTSQKVGGLIYGAHAEVEGWITRNYWLAFEFEKNLGSYSNKSGETSTDSYGFNQDIQKFKFGYRYLPLGFFYGPRVDGYLGFGKYSYELDTSVVDGFGVHTFSGLLVGFKASLPFHRVIRGFLKFDIGLGADYEEEGTIFGSSASSVSSYQIELGMNYVYNPQITINGSFEITSNKAKFNGNQEAHFREAAFKSGASFSF